MLIRVVRMTFRAESVAQFLQNFDAYKSQIRQFPGFLHLELWQDENDQNVFSTYSHWEDEHVLNQYRDSEIFKSVWAQTKPLFAAKPMAFSSKIIRELP